jgi:hypothetical protein
MLMGFRYGLEFGLIRQPALRFTPRLFYSAGAFAMGRRTVRESLVAISPRMTLASDIRGRFEVALQHRKVGAQKELVRLGATFGKPNVLV